MRNIYHIVFCFILILVFNSCANLEKNYPKRTYYTLQAQRPEGNYGEEIDKILELTRLNISPNFQGREFIYKLSKNKYDSDFYNQFFKPPASIVSVEVGRWIQSSKIFKNVIDPYTPILPYYVLYGNVVEIFADYSESDPKAVLSILFFLVDESQSDSKIILNSSYREKTRINSKSAKSLVEGWNTALAIILSNLESDLKKLDL